MRNLPKIALGAWAWGNDGTFGNDFTADTLKPIFDAAMASGLNLWDTAYAYGMGTSEKVLAGFIKDLPRESYLISDKFTPQCANGQPTAMADMIDMQLRLMSLDRFDIYWIHNVWDAPHWTEELAKYYEGRDDVPLLGVSNHNLSEIKQANDILKEIPHNTAAHLAVPFPTSAACRFLDLPPVNLRNLQLHLSKNSLAS